MCEIINKDFYKRKIRENTVLYYKHKSKHKEIYELMLITKTALKNYQIIYWENKELRNNIAFIKLYADLKGIYNNAKAKYLASCRMLKFYKDRIKEWNRKLGKINHG